MNPYRLADSSRSLGYTCIRETAWQKICEKIYRIVVNVSGRVVISIKLPYSADFLSRAQIRRKPVTVGESVRINKQLCRVAGLAEGQGGD
jgi:hypothetical protein